MKSVYAFCFFALFLVSCAKKQETASAKLLPEDTLLQKDGTVIAIPRQERNLLLLKRDQTVYSEGYKERLRKIAAWYMANSKQSLIRFHASKPESVMGYSIEENDWEDVRYTQIGIFSKSGSNVATLQWLFYEPKAQKLFEFDLYKKQLVEFKIK